MIIPLCACPSVPELLHLVLIHTIEKKHKKKDTDCLESVQESVMKMNRKLESLLCEERLKE